MENEFVSYQDAVALKELGFDEPCFCIWNREKKLRFNNLHNPNDRNKNAKLTTNNGRYPAPLYQQAMRWLHEQLNISGMMPTNIEKQQIMVSHVIEILRISKS